MYAIIKTDGKSYKVTEGETLWVDYRKNTNEKEIIEFSQVQAIVKDDEKLFGTPYLENAKVVAKVVEPLAKGDKLIVYKKKRRKNYDKKIGHRQKYTKVMIEKIEV